MFDLCTFWLQTSLQLGQLVINVLWNLIDVGLLLSFSPQNLVSFAKFGPRPRCEDALKFHGTDWLFCTFDARNALYLHSWTLWNHTFQKFVHLNTCSQSANAVFCFFWQIRAQFFKTFGHKYVKLLNIYLFFDLILWLVYSMTPNLSTPGAIGYKCFVRSN